jgi:hypothetical protein
MSLTNRAAKVTAPLSECKWPSAIATTAYDESGAAVHRAAQTTGKEGEALAQNGNVKHGGTSIRVRGQE